ncbi:MAG: hypothetical protein LBB09_01460 [Rickettsiales bacterium]|jgi:glutamyl-tRNA synthetase|nr:hypothetical protein [Rickettsiales bacterium]
MDKLAEVIFGNGLPSPEEIFSKYPPRGLAPEQKVTRIAPSPTGFVHLGTLYMGLISERIAHRSGGIFFMRLEDTDKKREVEGSADALIRAFKTYNIMVDEGATAGNGSLGDYGPYRQSERRDIYRVFAKDLFLRGLAYPCFCDEKELGEIIAKQKSQNSPRLGYYKGWAKYRNFPPDEALKKIKNGEEYALRFRSDGDFNKKIIINDALKGNVEFPENDLDIVLIKGDGLPTYHFAHVVDDFLMGTTLVTRGDEWLPSTPLHFQLFRAMRWRPPRYAHISPILKMEDGGKRKLSKRKDPESNIDYFEKIGCPKEAVTEYLMNLANSGFEDWRKQNIGESYLNFPFELKKMNVSGALFDFAKLSSVSRGVVGYMTPPEIYNRAAEWAKKYDAKLFDALRNNGEKCLKIFNVERENPKKIRKDIGKWSDIWDEIDYYFEYDPTAATNLLKNFDPETTKLTLGEFANGYNEDDSNDQWFEKIKNIARALNYATDLKDYKANPNNYRGCVSDIAKILRAAITLRENSPNLYEIMKILGAEETKKRLLAAGGLAAFDK